MLGIWGGVGHPRSREPGGVHGPLGRGVILLEGLAHPKKCSPASHGLLAALFSFCQVQETPSIFKYFSAQC